MILVDLYNVCISGVAVRGAVVMQTPDEGVNHISLNLDDHLMAICTGCDVNIYSLQVKL